MNCNNVTAADDGRILSAGENRRIGVHMTQAIAIPATEDSSEYTSDNIQVLKGLEAVRVRPGMYIGSTGVDGLHHLIKELLGQRGG